MDPVKVQAIHDWTQPTSLKSLQKFLSFANFYRRFICNFSSIAKPLTDLTKKGADVVNWSSAAVEAFQELKRRFSSAPVLCQPDVSLPFQVEVDASEIGAGAVLSQRSSDCSVMKPCAFFSRKFSPAERNYDVGNRELLAMKWAFEEWRHWLEGAKHRVVVLTDHKNLTYLESAKWLNPRQARWSLFFARFDFVISYLPGSKNVKADALSRSFVPDSPGLSEPAGILKEGTNGQTERNNQTLETYLRCFVSADQDDWVSFLPLAEFALNNRASSATLVSPFFCNSGFHPRFSSGQVESSDCPGVDTVVDRLQQIWTHVVNNLTLSQEKAQRFANHRRCVGPRLRVGDLVWLSSRHIPMKVSSPKFKPRFIGPYRISEVLNPVSFRLTLPDSFSIHNVFHRSLLRRYVAPMVPSVDPPAPVLVEGELEYIVEKILDSRVSRRKLQYLVKWKGYAQEDNSWVFASDVHAPDLVRAFHMAHPGRPGGSACLFVFFLLAGSSGMQRVYLRAVSSREKKGGLLKLLAGASAKKKSRSPPSISPTHDPQAMMEGVIQGAIGLEFSITNHGRAGSCPIESEMQGAMGMHPLHRKTGSLDLNFSIPSPVRQPACAMVAVRPEPKSLSRERYRVVVPYPPQSEAEIELKEGDIVFVHKKREDGWYKGTLQRNGRTGLFPGSFVESF
ncbi:unnamed protein product [Ranitomeya imitator]|uniref:RING-type E3 ubiquitin transferase n=1 Tax=Ranitomeya imitator TaxID=111125 RepID=A0ABN9M2X1_9NEOB|nr:unnamed protein product [Ranitomeya imitator]